MPPDSRDPPDPPDPPMMSRPATPRERPVDEEHHHRHAAARPASRSKNPRRYMNSEITSVRRAGPPPVSGMMRSNVLNDAIVMSTRFNAITGASGGISSQRSRCHAG